MQVLGEYFQNRVREINQKPILEKNEFVLYWMQAFRRLESNHSLDYAVSIAKQLEKPLVVYEGLRMDYKWNSERIHKFILEGMCDNTKVSETLGINYWSFVETKENPAKGLLKKICEKASVVITDDFPCFIIPEQTLKLSQKIDCKLIAIDGNGIVPLKLYGGFQSQARFLRIRLHKLFSDAFQNLSKASYKKKDLEPVSKFIKPPFQISRVTEESIPELLKNISFANSVSPNKKVKGGRKEGLKILKQFLQNRLEQYGDRSIPRSPEEGVSSGLSPYLHFGHISQEEVAYEVLNSGEKKTWNVSNLDFSNRSQRDGFFSKSDAKNGFLDELLTWRDVGYAFFYEKPEFRKDLSALPNWVKENFQKHKNDKREFLYSQEEFETSKTHDRLWNLAQTELRATGRMHNYLRMLWGKKVIEWTRTYEEAFEILEHLNNLYAYDGRNPNSYTGILWCFGLFDRPWFPERNVFGNVRYMSSASTQKKFKIEPYIRYVENLEGGDGLFHN